MAVSNHTAHLALEMLGALETNLHDEEKRDAFLVGLRKLIEADAAGRHTSRQSESATIAQLDRYDRITSDLRKAVGVLSACATVERDEHKNGALSAALELVESAQAGVAEMAAPA